MKENGQNNDVNQVEKPNQRKQENRASQNNQYYQSTDCNNQYDEISLKEIIEALINKKKMIACITVLFMICGIIMSFVIINPKYASTTTISVTPTIGSKNSVSDVGDLLESFSQIPVMSVESYREQVKSHEVLEKVIERLELKNDKDEYIKSSALASKINVAIVKNTNLINITTNEADSDLAAKISNAVSESFIEFISEKTRKRGVKSGELIEAQLEIEEENLNEKSKALTEYISNNQSIDELKAQKNSLISQITGYKSSLNAVEKNIMTEKASLAVLLGDDYKDIEKNISEDVELNMDINGNISEDIKLDIADAAGLQDALLTVKVTNLETSLIGNIASKNSLEMKIKDMEDRLKIAQTDLAEQEHGYNSILRDFNLAKSTYDAYQNRHKQAMITAASDIGQTSVVISSYAVSQSNPISPNKKMIVAISAILGLMISIFAALFTDYWKKA